MPSGNEAFAISSILLSFPVRISVPGFISLDWIGALVFRLRICNCILFVEHHDFRTYSEGVVGASAVARDSS